MGPLSVRVMLGGSLMGGAHSKRGPGPLSGWKVHFLLFRSTHVLKTYICLADDTIICRFCLGRKQLTRETFQERRESLCTPSVLGLCSKTGLLKQVVWFWKHNKQLYHHSDWQLLVEITCSRSQKLAYWVTGIFIDKCYHKAVFSLVLWAPLLNHMYLLTQHKCCQDQSETFGSLW